MPDLVYEAQDQVPEPIRSLAVERDGKWVASVVPKSELDDFRNRNIQVSKERDTLNSTIGRLTTDLGVKVEELDGFVQEVTDLRGIKKQVDDGKLVADSSLEKAVEAKVGEMKRGYDAQVNGLSKQVTDLSSENTTLKNDLNRSIVDKEVMLAVTDPKSGALPEATRHILREAYDIFTVDENKKLVPKDPDGNVIYGQDGASPMKPAEWLHKLQETNPFFFKGANGGGGGGGRQSGPLSAAEIAAMSPEEKMNYGREHGLNR